MITSSKARHRLDFNPKQGSIEGGCDNLQPVVYCPAVAVF
jgi:hypothetical protein